VIFNKNQTVKKKIKAFLLKIKFNDLCIFVYTQAILLKTR